MKFILILLFYYLYQFANTILDRDFYQYLEIPVSATPQSIRQAFKRLSKKYHPDRNPKSKNRFQKINVAYQTLIDSHKKYYYDRLGKQKYNQPNIQSQYNLQSLKGPQLKTKINLPLKDFYTGVTLPILIQKRVACPHCKGTGAENPYDIVTCRQCGGKGKTTQKVELGGGHYNLFTNQCTRCSGTGKVIGRKCHLCNSNKIIQGIQQFNFTVLPGTPSGFHSKYQNMGDQRLQGAPSDLIFQLIQVPHPYFRRNGNDLWAMETLTLREALFGFKKMIKHLDGRQIWLTSKDISQPGQIKIIQGEGMPYLNQSRKGNLYVQLRVVIPEFGDQQLNILQQFFANIQNN